MTDKEKELLKEKIKDAMKISSQKLREKKNTLEQNITSYASSNNLSSSTIQISDGKLKFQNTRIPEPLTFKYLEKTLGEVIKNESQIKLIMDHIRQKRNIKTVQEIKRFSNN
jgi:hypothetical protein